MARLSLVPGLVAFLALGSPASAPAYETSLATGEVHVSGALVAYRLHVSAHDLAVALGIQTDPVRPVPATAFDRRRAALAGYLRDRVAVTAQGALCTRQPPILDDSELPESVVLVLRFDCPARVTRLGLRYGLFFDLDPSHRAVGRVVLRGRDEPFVFDRSLRRLDVDVTTAPAPPRSERLGRLFALGLEHIVTGYDHLLFLLALLLASVSFWSTVKIVCALAAAHSLTLALAWSAAVQLSPRLVETAIAATVAWVAFDNVIGRGGSHRWLLAGGLGLVHGLGLYDALQGSGLAGARAPSTLLAFNLGVETGQVALVVLAYLPLRWWARRPWYRASARAGSAVILLAAVWWVIERAAGR